MKVKLNVDFRKYIILGACNPPSDYEALQTEDKIGLMMPCNVIVQETSDGRIEAAAIYPLESMSAVANQKLRSVAREVRAKLEAVIDNL